VAAELNAPAIDLPAMIESRKISLPEFLVPDGVHLSTAGNKAYAEMVLDGLMKSGTLR
jgi:lysophospholipase L1-like esterase